MKFPFHILPFCKQLSFPYIKRGYVLNNEHEGWLVPIPLPVIRDKIYSPDRYLKGLWFYYMNHGRVFPNTPYDDLVYLPEPFNIYLYFHYLDVLANELNIWKRFYFPPNPNEVIIDVGAGCGETAWLYYKYCSPKSVISIEPDKHRFKLLQTNSIINKWPNHILINDILRPEHFHSATFAKIDIEGAERFFYDYLQSNPIPFIMETHLDTIKLYSKYNQVWNNHRGCALVTNIKV